MVVSYQPKEFHRLADLHTTCLEDLFSLCFTRFKFLSIILHFLPSFNLYVYTMHTI